MLYDGLFSLDLPARLGPPVRVPWLQAIEHLLFEGRFFPRRGECALSSGAVLARCWDVLRRLRVTDVHIHGDADDVLDLRIPSEKYGETPPPWPELLPPEWTAQPSDFGLVARIERSGFCGVIHLRYRPRFEPETGPLTGAVRVMWNVRPENGHEKNFAADLSRSLSLLSNRGSLADLHHLLETAGEQLSKELLESLESVFPDSTGLSWGTVVVLVDEGDDIKRFADRLTGFPPEILLQLPVIRRLASEDLRERATFSRRAWDALDGNGVPGRWGPNGFEPVAEVIHGM